MIGFRKAEKPSMPLLHANKPTLHKEFRKYRHHGEWFRKSEDIVRHIDDCRNAHILFESESPDASDYKDFKNPVYQNFEMFIKIKLATQDLKMF